MSGLGFSDAFSPSRAISAGWEGLKRAPVAVVLGAIILLVSDSNCNFEKKLENGNWESFWWLVGAAILVGGFLGIILFLLRIFVLPGYLQVCARAVRGQKADPDQLFSASHRFLDMLLWGLLHTGVRLLTVLALGAPLVPFGVVGVISGREEVGIVLAVVAGFYVLAIGLPVFTYVELGLFFGDYRVALEGSGPLTALKESWNLASGNRLWLLLYRVIMFFFEIAGFLVMVVGVVFTRGIRDVGTVGAYLDFVHGPWTAPPSAPVPPS
ncbi:MAG: hypothetical protein KC729_04910, partial [Candidatus Eisenbacteria bacterium]|nr:hypothetical protein [Candidatus Eisenbacteria bacterium]